MRPDINPTNKKCAQIKKQHQGKLASDVEQKKASLDEMQKRKETNDVSGIR